MPKFLGRFVRRVELGAEQEEEEEAFRHLGGGILFWEVTTKHFLNHVNKMPLIAGARKML